MKRSLHVLVDLERFSYIKVLPLSYSFGPGPANEHQTADADQLAGHAANAARAQAGGQAIIRTCQIFSARARGQASF